jgi:hypothetical protein
MRLRFPLKTLLVAALALPVVECVLLGVRYLVLSMGDASGAALIGHIANVCLIIWMLSVVGLVILLAAIESLKPSEDDK